MSAKAKELRGLRRDGQRFIKQVRQLFKKHGGRLSEESFARMREALSAADNAIAGDDVEALSGALRRLEEVTDARMGHLRKSVAREYAESIGLAVIFALLLRAFVVEAFIIPSASMVPTLQEGDRLFVNKGAYGVRMPFTTTRLIDFKLPDRGDVVVFVFPRAEAAAHVETLPPHQRGCVDPGSLREEKDYIKRVVGLPGDRIKMVNNRLIVNGEPVSTQDLDREASDRHGYPFLTRQIEQRGSRRYTTQHYGRDANFGTDQEAVVKEGHVMVMGDNRDNSSDSRCWGQVPLSNIKGRAMFIWFSSDGDGIHWDRLGKLID